MCAIVGSFNRDKLKELFEINAYRGQLSYSLASFKTNSELQVVMKDKGKMPDYFYDEFPESDFYIGHTQAPTTESSNIHPAVNHEGDFLWHNGIIKQGKFKGKWDTEWLLDTVDRKSVV